MDLFYLVQWFADWLTYSVFGMIKETVLADAINFFIYDTIKIFILLCVIIFSFAIIRSYLPANKIKKLLTHKFSFVGNILAAMIGIITPFCSCSAVPLFIGLVESGVPLGVTFSYLIAAPMINEVAIVMLLGLFGWKIALIYVASGLLIAIIAGVILGKMNLEHLVQDYVWKIKIEKQIKTKNMIWQERINFAYRETVDLIKTVFPWVVAGVALGAFIHGYAPENLLAGLAGTWYAVPLAVLIGIPLYSNAAGILPVVNSLIAKGLPLGTALAFMMSVTALSLPEMIILRKVLKPKLLFIFIGVVALGILFTGYLFNFIM